MEDPAQHSPQEHLTRMVDLRIPLHWLLTGLMAGLWAIISMWFSVSALVKNVADLQILVSNSNSNTSAVVNEISMLKYRQAATETELARINEILRNDQRNQLNQQQRTK